MEAVTKYKRIRVVYYSGTIADVWLFNNMTKERAVSIVEKRIKKLRIVNVLGKTVLSSPYSQI